MVRSRKKILVAVAAGALLAGLPVLAFNLWLDHLIEWRGRQDVEISARRTIVVADGRLSLVVTSLAELAQRGVNSCSLEHVAALREAAFATATAKEIAVLGPDGQVRCTDHGLALGRRELVSPRRVGMPGDNLVEVVRLPDRNEQWLRVRHIVAGGNDLAALLPSNLFVPMTSNRGAALNACIVLTTTDGTLVGERGPASAKETCNEDPFVYRLQSDRFGVAVAVSMARAQVGLENSHLNILRHVLNGAVAVLLLGLGLSAPWWRREQFGSEIEHALAAGEFIPYYQPLVDIKSGRIVGAEVLARWRKADGSLVSPGIFIPLVEQRGQMREMTRVLMRRVRQEAGVALGGRPRVKISFNLAAEHFADDTVVEEVRSIFQPSPIRMSQLVFEVTERQPLDNMTSTRRVIAALQGLGCKVALDDVGTGHNGLSHILKLGIDIIKIDKMFVDGIGGESNSTTIIETLVDLAQNMRMEIVAEGVENFDQVAYLRDHGVRTAQGFVFSPPLPASSFLALLEAIDPMGDAAETEGSANVPRYISARNRVTAA